MFIGKTAGESVLNFLQKSMSSARRSWAKLLNIDAGKSALNVIGKAMESGMSYKRAASDVIDLTGSRQSPFLRFIKGVFGFSGGDRAIAAINSTATIAESIGGFSTAAKKAGKAVSQLAELKGNKEFGEQIGNIIKHFNTGNFEDMNKSVSSLLKAIEGKDEFKNIAAAAGNLATYGSAMNNSLTTLRSIGFDIKDYGGFFKWASNLSEDNLKTLQSFKGLSGIGAFGISAMGGLSRGGFVGGTVRAALPILGVNYTMKALQAPAKLVDIVAEDLRRRGSI